MDSNWVGSGGSYGTSTAAHYERHDQSSSLEAGQSSCQPPLNNSPTDEAIPSEGSSIRATLGLTARLVYGCGGSSILIGPSANLSALQNFREVTYYALGPNDFTKTHAEKDLADATPAVAGDWTQATVEPARPTEMDARYLIHWFVIISSCVFDLLSMEDLRGIIPWLEEPAANTDTAVSCINFLVLAIGALCGPQERDAEAEAYFVHARFLASTRFYEAPSIPMVQIQCLIINYLLHASRPIAANMHLGMAVRAAYSLGMHRGDLSAMFPPSECCKRERTWKVMRVLDLYLSTSLGQAPCTTETRDPASVESYSAALDLCCVFEKVLRGLYDKQVVCHSLLEHVSQHHRTWTTRFRDGFAGDQILGEDDYLNSDSLNGMAKNEANIGIYHLKGGYYWTVLLVTRPYLIDLVNKRIPYDGSRAQAEASADEKHTLLAHASVDAAVQSVELLKPLLDAQDIPRRLPYEVTFTFISASVLGIGLFADLDRVFPISRTMYLAERILALFELTDPLAQWCLNVVRDMREICDKFAKHRFECQLKYQRGLVNGIFGDMRPPIGNRGVTPLVPTPVSRGVPVEERISLARGEGVGISEERWAMEFSGGSVAGSPFPGEHSSIWNQLFADGTPGPILWTPMGTPREL